MKKSILNLGIVLSQSKQKSIHGNGSVLSLQPCECNPHGVIKFRPCDWDSRSFSCGLFE